MLLAAGLLVVGLMGLVVGWYLPGQEVEKQCMTRMERVASALQVYAADADGFYPPAARWREAVAPYLGSDLPEALACPQPGKHRAAYWLNGEFDRLLWPPELSRRAGAAEASRTVMLFEGPTEDRSWGRREDLVTPHLGGANCAFADGHVAWQRPRAASSDQAWRPPDQPAQRAPQGALDLVYQEPEARAQLLARVLQGDAAAVEPLRAAVVSAEPLEAGGTRWAPPLVDLAARSGNPEVARAAEQWLSTHTGAIRMGKVPLGVALPEVQGPLGARLVCGGQEILVRVWFDEGFGIPAIGGMYRVVIPLGGREWTAQCYVGQVRVGERVARYMVRFRPPLQEEPPPAASGEPGPGQ